MEDIKEMSKRLVKLEEAFKKETKNREKSQKKILEIIDKRVGRFR